MSSIRFENQEANIARNSAGDEGRVQSPFSNPQEALNDIRALNNVQQSTPTNAKLPGFSIEGLQPNPKDSVAGSAWIYDSNRSWSDWVKDAFTPGHDDPNNRAKWIENQRFS